MSSDDPIIIIERGVNALRLGFPYPPVPKGGGGYIYVMGPPDGDWVKVGITIDLMQRMRGFLCESGSRRIALFHVVQHPRHAVVEQCAHGILQGFRTISERFTVKPEFAVAAIAEAVDRVGRSPDADYSRRNWNVRTGELNRFTNPPPPA